MPKTVQIVITFNIAPTAVSDPVATPSAVTEDLTVGVAVPPGPVAQVSGGTPPYSQPTVDAASANPLPPGLAASIDASGNVSITGTPTTAGTGTVILDVADASA